MRRRNRNRYQSTHALLSVYLNWIEDAWFALTGPAAFILICLHLAGVI